MFKVGDRVVGVGEFWDRNIDGKLGTIKEICSINAAVYFDEPIGGWADGTLGIPQGHGWNVPMAQLKHGVTKEIRSKVKCDWSLCVHSNDGVCGCQGEIRLEEVICTEGSMLRCNKFEWGGGDIG